MKPFEIDWADFIERLTEWDRLSLAARKAFAELKSDRGTELTGSTGASRTSSRRGF